MGLMEEAEKVAGAIAAAEGLKKLDPNANLLEEAAAAITGFEATGGIVEKIEEKIEEAKEHHKGE
jgi:hypothetical protein